MIYGSTNRMEYFSADQNGRESHFELSTVVGVQSQLCRSRINIKGLSSGCIKTTNDDVARWSKCGDPSSCSQQLVQCFGCIAARRCGCLAAAAARGATATGARGSGEAPQSWNPGTASKLSKLFWVHQGWSSRVCFFGVVSCLGTLVECLPYKPTSRLQTQKLAWAATSIIEALVHERWCQAAMLIKYFRDYRGFPPKRP